MKKLFDVTTLRIFTDEYQNRWRKGQSQSELNTHQVVGETAQAVRDRWNKNNSIAMDRMYHDELVSVVEISEEELAKRKCSDPRRCCDKAINFFCVCALSFLCPEHGSRHIGTHD